MGQPKYKLTYYNFRGIVEPVRLIFAYAGVAYEDVRIPGDAEHFPKLPESIKKGLPFGRVPVLEFEGKTITQMTAIARFLAKQFNLTGKDDYESAKCDELVEVLKDIEKERKTMSSTKDPERKAALEKTLREKTFPFYMSKLEKMVTDNGGKYYVGSGVTWADLCMVYYVELLNERLPAVVDHFPGVKAAAKGIADLPPIKTWIETRPTDDTPPMPK